MEIKEDTYNEFLPPPISVKKNIFAAMKTVGTITVIILSVILCAFATQGPKPVYSKAALGKRLFSEKILSLDSSVSCASCHNPNYAFADTVAFSKGINGKPTSRNTPSVLNMKNRPYYFWDGRAGSLEIQALVPIQNADEMGLPVSEAVARLNKSKLYKDLFLKTFKQLPNPENLAAALSAYEQTLETVDSRFDDWSNNMGKLSPAEERGRQLFIGKAKCFDCHAQEDFTTDAFKNIGLYNETSLKDAGLFNITQQETDKGKFKVPGLRNVAVTAPYMHNGMFETLEQVLEYYNDPAEFISNSINMDSTLQKGLNLEQSEKNDLIAFLESLTDRKYRRTKSR